MAALSITATSIVPVASPSLGNLTAAIYQYGVALAAITAGQVVYSDGAGGIGLFDGDSATAAVHTLMGLAVGPAVAAGQQVAVQIAGQCAFGAILTKGLIYCGSPTAGAIIPSADQTTNGYINVLGYALSTSVMEIKPFNAGVAI
jgi:hypothetical protein